MPQVLEKGVKRMEKRKKGAQPGNSNALRHGKYSVARRAERRAAREAEHAERALRHAEWLKTIPKTDYASIVEGLKRLKHRLQ
jgi:cob(I)alamin adenosyltransferase